MTFWVRAVTALALQIAVCSVVSQAAPPAIDLEKLLQEAESQYSQDSWSEAENLLAQLLDTLEKQSPAPAPQNAARIRRRALFLLADVYRRLGRSDDALAMSLAFRREIQQLRGGDNRILLRDITLSAADDHMA